MPFTTTTTQPSTNSLVTVEFAGLMLLRPGLGETCEIGVHRWALAHTFQVMLIVSKPQRAPTVIRLFTGPLDANFVIQLFPDQPGDFKAYAPAPGVFAPNEFNATTYPLDYRWRLNLRDLHPNAEYNEGAKPIVQVKTGVLYTPNLTPVDLNPSYVSMRPTVPPPPPKPLYRFAADLAVAIQPPANTKVRLEWRELGQTQTKTLPRDNDPAGTTYTVSIMNDPPLSAPSLHDELAEYYKILTDEGLQIPLDNRWRLQYGHDERTDEIPCMPGTLEP